MPSAASSGQGEHRADLVHSCDKSSREAARSERHACQRRASPCRPHSRTTRYALVSRPTGLPTLDNFAIAETTIGDPGPGEALVRITHMSVDPYMRGRMSEARSYVPPFKLNEVMTGGAVGFVIESNDPAMPAGQWVESGRARLARVRHRAGIEAHQDQCRGRAAERISRDPRNAGSHRLGRPL